MLYAGPYLLRKYIPTEFYQHFLLLHFAIYALISDQALNLVTNAQWCLDTYIITMSSLYTDASLVYNIHNLMHLPGFVHSYGSLDNFSAFPFENYLRILKQSIKGNSYVFEQSIDSMYKIRTLFSNYPDRTLEYTSIYPNNFCITFEKCVVQITSISKDGLVD